jgi:hypothetical protein
MAGSLSVATTAVSSANVAVVDSGEVGRSAVYSRYNIGRRTLPLGIPALQAQKQFYISILSSERAPHFKKPAIVRQKAEI